MALVSLGDSLTRFPDPRDDDPLASSFKEAQAILAGGCFWCIEAIFRQVHGVSAVVSGYAGGRADQANYEAVCRGDTRHAEAVRITYDASHVTFGQLLKVFFSVAHDPTQLDRQGPDIGPQYRSAIFYLDQRQKEIAERYIRQLDAATLFDRPVATRLESCEAFFEAEMYHQNYVEKNPRQPYVVSVANPKLEKLRCYFDNSGGYTQGERIGAD